MTNDEKNLLEYYREMKQIYSNDNLVICNPKTFKGYNIVTGKAIILKEVEIDDKCR